MAESTVIKEFLVAIGYKVDESSTTKIIGGINRVSKAAESLGFRIEATALAVAYGVARFASNLEQLYFAAQRTNSSADSLKAFDLAARNFGASIDEAQGSVENLAAYLRNNPGGDNVIAAWLGEVGLSAKGANGQMLQGTALMVQLGKMFAIQRREGHTYLASQIAGQLGISDRTMLAISSPGYAEEEAKQEKRAAGWAKVSEAAHRFMIQLEDLKMQFEQMMLGFEAPAMAALRTLMTKVSKLLHDHGKQIVTDLTVVFTWAIEGIGKVLDWLDRNGKEALVRIEAMWLDFQFDFELYIKPVLEWLWTQFTRLDEATNGWSTKLLVVSGALKALGATGIVTGILSLGAGIAKAATGALGLAVDAGAWGVAGTAFGLAAWAGLGVGLGALLDHFFPESTQAAGSWVADRVEDLGNLWDRAMARNREFHVDAVYGDRPDRAALDAKYSPHFEINLNTTVHGSLGGDPHKTAGYVASETERAVRRAASDLTREFLATVK